jgi:hypothetical protein
MEEDTRCHIATLPDELLASIFALLSHSVYDHNTLYVAVPAVCTRWLHVCSGMANLHISFSCYRDPALLGRSTRIESLYTTRDELSAIMRQFHSFTSVDLQFAYQSVSANVMSLLPSFAHTLQSLQLKYSTCTPDQCHLRIISRLCVNLTSLTMGEHTMASCTHSVCTADDIKCTNLRTLKCSGIPTQWLALVLDSVPLNTLTLYGWGYMTTPLRLVFRYPAAVTSLDIVPYMDQLTPDQRCALFKGMHNLTHLTITPMHWTRTMDAIRTECPNLETVAVKEAYKADADMDYTVFHGGFSKLRILSVYEEWCADTYHPAMFAPLLALPALTHFITEYDECAEEAAITLPNVTCITWCEWHAH